MCIDIMGTLNSSPGMRCYGLFTPYGQLLGLFLLFLLYTTIVCCSYIYPAVTEEDYDYGLAIQTPLIVGASILFPFFFLIMRFIGSRVNTCSTTNSFIGDMHNAIMKLPIYFTLHMRIGGHIMDIISK